MLVAYIDGELDAGEKAALERRLAADPALGARLAELRRGGRDFAAAYDVLLAAAPTERLNAMLKGMTVPRQRRSVARMVGAIAAALVIFAIGAAAGLFAPRILNIQVAEEPQPPNWRQVVAEYITLTTADTLAAIPVDAGFLDKEVAAISKRVSLSLSTAKLSLPHVYLKKAEALDFRGRPLVQFAYLSPDAGPIAFCIIASAGRADTPRAFEQREGSNIVFWNKDGRGYMLIGKAPRDALEKFADSLAAQVS